METIELHPKRLRIAMQMFFIFFVYFFFVGFMKYGFFCRSEVWLVLRARAIESLVATLTFSLGLSIIFPRKHQSVMLTRNALRAPMKKKGLGLWKSATVDLSKVIVSRYLIDRLSGTQLVTCDGKIIHINTFIFPASTVRKLLDEIEVRQELVEHPNPDTDLVRATPTE